MPKITQWWLSTTDNPYDPFDEYEQWYNHDENVLHYRLSGLMARFSTAPYDAPEAVLQASNKEAIGIILRDIPLLSDTGQYKVVTREIDIDDT